MIDLKLILATAIFGLIFITNINNTADYDGIHRSKISNQSLALFMPAGSFISTDITSSSDDGC